MRYLLSLLQFILLSLSLTAQNTDPAVALRAEIDSLLNLNKTLLKAYQFGPAIETAQAAFSISRENFGRQDSLYVQSLIHLSTTTRWMGKFQDSEAYLQEADTLLRSGTFEFPLHLQGSLMNQFGTLYLYTGKLEQCEEAWVEAEQILRQCYGETDEQYLRLASNLGLAYMFLGQFERAESFWLRNKESLLPRGPSDALIAAVSNLGGLYIQMGQFEAGLQATLHARELIDSLGTQESSQYIQLLNNLGTIYQVLGQTEKAEPFFLDALEVTERIRGKDNPDYAASLYNVGMMLAVQKQYEQAEQYFLEALAVRKQIYGDKHGEVGLTQRRLGHLYVDTDRLDLAEQYFLLAKEGIPETYSSYCMTLLDLGNIYKQQGLYQKAEPWLLQAKAALDTLLDKQHPVQGTVLQSLADLYLKKGQLDKAAQLLTEAIPILEAVILQQSRHSTEQELGAFIQTFESRLHQFFSAVHLGLAAQPKMTELCFDQALFFKGYLLQTSNEVKRLVKGNAEVEEKFNLWKSYQRRLADQYAKPLEKQSGVAELEQKAAALEKELVQAVEGFREGTRQVYWRDVQQQLGPNEAVLEFISYNLYDQYWTDSVMYAALLLKAGQEAPQFIPLFEEGELLDLINAAENIRSANINELYAGRGGRPKPVATRGLLELNWKPIEAELAGIQRIYFVPSGLLHRINLGAIPLNKSEILADRYELIQLSSSRQLAGTAESQRLPTKALLMGGIQYDLDTPPDAAAPVADAANESMELSIDFAGRSLLNGRWEFLEWTAGEVQDIANVLRAADVPVNLKSKAAATEDFLRAAGMHPPSPQILHLATHGFFFPDPESTLREHSTEMEEASSFSLSEHPMIRSGLILAGANEVWTGKEALPGREDGILTAYEISQLDLSNTELVVLSACETGLGDIQGNEGVYGLQRAFKIAGARYLIMSLWQVPDQETQEFMSTFYREWLEQGRTIPEAFRRTQALMRKKYKAPYAWAGFVLVE